MGTTTRQSTCRPSAAEGVAKDTRVRGGGVGEVQVGIRDRVTPGPWDAERGGEAAKRDQSCDHGCAGQVAPPEDGDDERCEEREQEKDQHGERDREDPDR